MFDPGLEVMACEQSVPWCFGIPVVRVYGVSEKALVSQPFFRLPVAFALYLANTYEISLTTKHKGNITGG